MAKATFVLDQRAIDRLRVAAERLARPQSWVVREAICEYAERIGRMSERERRQWLRDFDTLVPRIPERPLSEVQAELRNLRRARRRGGRRSIA